MKYQLFDLHCAYLEEEKLLHIDRIMDDGKRSNQRYNHYSLYCYPWRMLHVMSIIPYTTFIIHSMKSVSNNFNERKSYRLCSINQFRLHCYCTIFFCKITRVYQIKYFMKRNVLTAFLIHTQLSLLFLTIQNY